MNSPLLKATDVTKEYIVGDNKIQALKGVSLEIHEGEFVSIVGKSGSGKSTLMHLIGLLDTPTTGSIVLKGTEISKYSEKQLAKIRNKEIGFVFQFFNLLQRATSLDNVTLPLKYSLTPKSQWNDKAVKMLQQVGLGDRIYNKSNELSGGQKQRVAIARALVNDPAIIFADEPTGNLDSKTGEEITNLFKELNNQGKTIILVTHDDDLAKIAKRQITIKDGYII
jgi:putative ABC transport system ATP-binding protein